MKLDDMRLFAEVARAQSFTAAARALGVPKQTLSRRVAELEHALGVTLLHRTTRKLHLTELGAAYAERCMELVRLAEEADRAITESQLVPRGLLRVTADPLFGEAFLGRVVIEYASRWPDVSVEVLLTRRRVSLVEEGFDVAFRVGHLDDPTLTARKLGPARIRYCASPAYLKRRGTPETPEDLGAHECIAVTAEGAPVQWPFAGRRSPKLVPVSGRLRLSSSALAHEAALAGLGIALFPEFACADDIRRGRLVPVLDEHVVDVGAVWLVYPTNRYLSARARTFLDLAIERLGVSPPWVIEKQRRARRR